MKSNKLVLGENTMRYFMMTLLSIFILTNCSQQKNVIITDDYKGKKISNKTLGIVLYSELDSLGQYVKEEDVNLENIQTNYFSSIKKKIIILYFKEYSL